MGRSSKSAASFSPDKPIRLQPFVYANGPIGNLPNRTASLSDADCARLDTAMLLHGANINARDEQGRTALYWAVYFRHNQTAKLLIERGADVNLGEVENPPLRVAINQNPALIRLLLDHNADVNCMSRLSLLYSVVTNDRNAWIVKELLKHHADVNYRWRQSLSPLELAKLHKAMRIATLLKQAGAK